MSSPFDVLQPAARAACRNAVSPCPAITSPTNMADVSFFVSIGKQSSFAMPLGVALQTISHPVGSGGPDIVRPRLRVARTLANFTLRASSTSWMINSRTPASRRATPMALPAPPAPSNRTRASWGRAPFSICAFTNEFPSSTSPCQPLSGFRRITLIVSRSAERLETVVQ